MIDDPTLNHLIKKDPLIGRFSLQDQREYLQLYQYFQSCDEKNKRNHGMDTFITHLIKVHQFINQKDCFDIYRGFVCGIEFGRGFIIVNTKRLKRLMWRSKSCVNGCLQKLGYQMNRKEQDVSGFFTTILPGVEAQLCNSRQWCVRKRTSSSPVCFVSFLPSILTDRYGFPQPCDLDDEDYEEEPEPPSYQDPFPYLDVKALLNNHKSNVLV
ncbi:hypothetical protein TVAG_153430 [Trichomonas vaginalis G3]|uniref:Initiator binding domain-containing protein n=1 Tax=Trichomonas vaginalis (strain ATCC PRA-98 / G3) TaxID=412133 RepID=A2G1T0_TRIV3|nr:transcription-initiator DNA-binding domain ibd family [Trichomonas vaginalis G3]EAX88881.1 hypothetical protein TVAG_153430 [Trichomonas vaginalis G3]KAI5508543.1 transcription-initiator DNA-binding domain ibd family [Trichomonas vaginalis G3]|eukprot:XP_001301811.1 hypothetical protein [Trichomonas vaginalis G3]